MKALKMKKYSNLNYIFNTLKLAQSKFGYHIPFIPLRYFEHGYYGCYGLTLSNI